MLNYIEYLDIPTKIAGGLVGVILLAQVIGEVLELKGKVVPEFMKIRKYFSRKKQEKKEIVETLKNVQQLLSEVNKHYSDDNIQKRNEWMQWVNDRAVVYDGISNKMDDVIETLNNNTKMTEDIFVQNSRDRIIDFATKINDKDAMVTREEFNRIIKIHDKYEKFLKEHKMTNGEIDINYAIIQEDYAERTKNHTFIEDIRGY